MDISKEIKSAIDELDDNQLKSAKKCVEEAKKKGNVGRPSGVPTEESALRSYLRKAKLAVPGKRGRGTLEASKEVLQKRMDFLIREYKLTQSVLNEVFKEDIEKIKAKEDIVLGPTYIKRESDKKTAAENEVKREEALVVKSKRMMKKPKDAPEFYYKPEPRYEESVILKKAEDLEQAKKKLAKLAKSEEKRLKALKDIEDQRGITLKKEKEREKEELEQMEKEELEQRLEQRKIMKQRDKEQKEKEKKEIDEAEEKRLSDIRQKRLNERFAMEREELEQRNIMKEQKEQKEKDETEEKIKKKMKKYEDLLEKSKENESSETYNKLIKGYDDVISVIWRAGLGGAERGDRFEAQHKTYLKERKERKELLKKENKEIEDLLEKFKEGGYKSRKQAEELSKSSKANKYPSYTPKIKRYIGRYNDIVLEKIARKEKEKELEGSGREGRKSLRQSLVLQLIRPTNLNMNTRDF